MLMKRHQRPEPGADVNGDQNTVDAKQLGANVAIGITENLGKTVDHPVNPLCDGTTAAKQERLKRGNLIDSAGVNDEICRPMGGNDVEHERATGRSGDRVLETGGPQALVYQGRRV